MHRSALDPKLVPISWEREGASRVLYDPCVALVCSDERCSAVAQSTGSADGAGPALATTCASQIASDEQHCSQPLKLPIGRAKQARHAR